MAADLIKRVIEFDDPILESPATDEMIESFESTLDVELPASFKEFLKRSNGGEFCFARMLTPFISESIDNMSGDEAWSDLTESVYPKHELLMENLLLPFGDDYSGNYYCFDLQNSDDIDCPVVLLISSMAEDDDPEPQADSFLEFIDAAMKD